MERKLRKMTSEDTGERAESHGKKKEKYGGKMRDERRVAVVKKGPVQPRPTCKGPQMPKKTSK